MRRTVRDILQELRPLVVSAHKGRQVDVDLDPRCPHCGKKLAEYLAVPWSLRCRHCGQQARRE